MRQAVILVGGRGTRLGELAQSTPKPLLPIDDDRRFLDYLIENFARHGVEQIILIAGHLGGQVEARYQGARFGACEILVVIEPEPAGTAGALWHARDLLDPVFLMSNGDSFFDFNLLALTTALEAQDEGAIALRHVPDARRYGAVEQAGGRVVSFREKDESLEGAWISGGVYVLRRDVLARIKTLPCSIESDIFPALAAEGRLGCATFEGYFLDIGLPDTLEQGRRELPEVRRRPAIFFDRDNTLNIDRGYTHKPEDLAWTPGAIEAVRDVNDAGWLAVVVTNQAGIGRGFYVVEQMEAFHRAMQGALAEAGAHIDAFYHCPYHPEAVEAEFRHPNHPDRKPNPGMLEAARRALPIDWSRSVMIGDQPSDIAAGEAAGLTGVLYTGGDLREMVRGLMGIEGAPAD
jgi:D-glycero-D-manno-heptose 1,7-bisphosphate phosphatase